MYFVGGKEVKVDLYSTADLLLWICSEWCDEEGGQSTVYAVLCFLDLLDFRTRPQVSAGGHRRANGKQQLNFICLCLRRRTTRSQAK